MQPSLNVLVLYLHLLGQGREKQKLAEALDTQMLVDLSSGMLDKQRWAEVLDMLSVMLAAACASLRPLCHHASAPSVCPPGTTTFLPQHFALQLLVALELLVLAFQLQVFLLQP